MLAIFSGYSGSGDWISFGVTGELTQKSWSSYILWVTWNWSLAHGSICFLHRFHPHEDRPGEKDKTFFQSNSLQIEGYVKHTDLRSGQTGLESGSGFKTLPFPPVWTGVYRTLWWHTALCSEFVRENQGSNRAWAGAYHQNQTLYTQDLGEILRCWTNCSGTFFFHLGLLARFFVTGFMESMLALNFLCSHW